MKKITQRIVIVMMTLILVFSSCVVSFGASPKSVKVYSERSVFKTGNYVYCSGDESIIRINLKNKKKEVICKSPGYDIHSIQVKGKYLYYSLGGNGFNTSLYRMNLKTKKIKKLTKQTVEAFNVKGKKIYYTKFKKGSDKTVRRVMKLNGKKKKKCKIKLRLSKAHTNNSKYKITAKSYYDNDDKCNRIDRFLITPKGKIFIETITF